MNLKKYFNSLLVLFFSLSIIFNYFIVREKSYSGDDKGIDFVFNDLNDKPLRLSDFRGKVVLVDVWATWCPPCVMEIPGYINLYNKYKDKGFEIIGVSVDEDGKINSKVQTLTIKGIGAKREYDMIALRGLLGSFIVNPTCVKMVILEKQQAMPGQGRVSMFRIGLGYGMWQGLLCALGLPYTLAHPKTWQKVMLSDVNKTDTKQAALLVAQRLYPDADFRATERCKKAHEGIVDALMMAEYGRRINK